VATPHQGKCLDIITSALPAALEVKSGNNKIIHEVKRLPLLMKLMTYLCPATSSGLHGAATA